MTMMALVHDGTLALASAATAYSVGMAVHVRRLAAEMRNAMGEVRAAVHALAERIAAMGGDHVH